MRHAREALEKQTEQSRYASETLEKQAEQSRCASEKTRSKPSSRDTQAKHSRSTPSSRDTQAKHSRSKPRQLKQKRRFPFLIKSGFQNLDNRCRGPHFFEVRNRSKIDQFEWPPIAAMIHHRALDFGSILDSKLERAVTCHAAIGGHWN